MDAAQPEQFAAYPLNGDAGQSDAGFLQSKESVLLCPPAPRRAGTAQS
jgi:hypothetical protein